MLNFLVNGKAVECNSGEDTLFGELVHLIRRDYNSSDQVISSLRVNGCEITETEEAAIASLPIREINTLEITTQPPLMLAMESMRTLGVYTRTLEKLSQRTGESYSESGFMEVVEGLTTFTEALNGIKLLLKRELPESIRTLEWSLFEVLRDILRYKRSGQSKEIIACLSKQLPTHLALWRTAGIPILLKSSHQSQDSTKSASL